ncbi:MAG: histidine kinase [Oscillospiraceae bacterium]|nr:histidine kinase [Oscillospiraceae bacterium]
MHHIEVVNLSVSIAAMTLALLNTLQVLVVRKLDRHTKHYFLWYNVFLLLFSGGNLAGLLLRGTPGAAARIALQAANYCEFLFSCVLAYIGAKYLLSLSDQKRKKKAVRIAFAVLLAVHIILLDVSQFTGLFYTIDSDNVYHREALYPLSLLCPGLLLLGSMAVLLRSRDRLSKRERIAFALYLTAPMAAMGIQSFFYGLNLIVFSVAMAVLVMFIFVLSDQSEKYYRQEQEAEQLKIDLMLGQIQPHFLYNSLGTIQALCRVDPEKAEKAVGDFSRFLRHNMQSIENDQPILFYQELRHTQNYLALQKLRFGDDLTIVYDLECEAFSLPTLTLQPLVENAVTHGIRQTENGRGTVTIRSRELEDHYELSVIDDGVGFDPETAGTGSGSHIALANIRARLARISGGSLRIVSAPGMGTTASILIPKSSPC